MNLVRSAVRARRMPHGWPGTRHCTGQKWCCACGTIRIRTGGRSFASRPTTSSSTITTRRRMMWRVGWMLCAATCRSITSCTGPVPCGMRKKRRSRPDSIIRWFYWHKISTNGHLAVTRWNWSSTSARTLWSVRMCFCGGCRCGLTRWMCGSIRFSFSLRITSPSPFSTIAIRFLWPAPSMLSGEALFFQDPFRIFQDLLGFYPGLCCNDNECIDFGLHFTVCGWATRWTGREDGIRQKEFLFPTTWPTTSAALPRRWV